MYTRTKRKIDITISDFHKLTRIECLSFFRTYSLCIEVLKTGEGLRIWMHQDKIKEYAEHPRFFYLNKVIMMKAEIGYIEVPENSELKEILYKGFKNYFLK